MSFFGSTPAAVPPPASFKMNQTILTTTNPHSGSYIQGSQHNNALHHNEQLNSSWKYRKHLQQNATKIIGYNTQLACAENNCFTSYTNDQQSANVPYLYTSCTERARPMGYESSDLKEAYLKHQYQECVLVAPEIKIGTPKQT